MVLSACGLLFVSQDEEPTSDTSGSGGFSEQPVEASTSELDNSEIQNMDFDTNQEKSNSTTEKRKRSEEDRDGGKGVYQCDKCEKKYYRWSHLVRHARNHSSEKRYTCPTCHKAFSRVDVMKRHKQKHLRNSQTPKEPLLTTKLGAPFDAKRDPMFQSTPNCLSNNKKGNNRVSKACKACSLAKIRCSEMKPCKSCVDKGLNCAVVQDEAEQQITEREENDRQRMEREIEEKIAKCLSITRNKNETIRSPRHPGCPWGFAPLVWPPDEEDLDTTPKPSNQATREDDLSVPDSVGTNHKSSITPPSSVPDGWEGVDPAVCPVGIGIGGVLRISHPTDASSTVMMKRNPIREAMIRSAMSSSNMEAYNRMMKHPCMRESTNWSVD